MAERYQNLVNGAEEVDSSLKVNTRKLFIPHSGLSFNAFRNNR